MEYDSVQHRWGERNFTTTFYPYMRGREDEK